MTIFNLTYENTQALSPVERIGSFAIQPGPFLIKLYYYGSVEFTIFIETLQGKISAETLASILLGPKQVKEIMSSWVRNSEGIQTDFQLRFTYEDETRDIVTFTKVMNERDGFTA